MRGVPAVELCDLAIGYRRRRGRATTVASGLHAVARSGELTALLGPNGCGKSTLIRTLCGVQPVLAGGVLLEGVDLTRMSRADCAQRVAVVLTDRVDPGLLSVRELVGLGRIPYVGPTARLSADDHAIVDWALDAVHAQYLAARPVTQLSDGERQRVLTARALAQQTALLVLDEPTAFLDIAARVGLVEMLRGLAREHGLAIIISTHELELALRVADRVWLLDAEGTLRDAIPEELMLAGHLDVLFDGTLFGRNTVRFDPTDGVFMFSAAGGRCARIEAPKPLGGVLQRVLSRENWSTSEPAEIVITATDAETITVSTGTQPAALATLSTLPVLLRTLAVSNRTCVPAAKTVAALSEVSAIGPFFTIGTGPLAEDGWLPVQRLYTDLALCAGIIATIQDRIHTPDRRVAVSTFFLGFAARLWSIGIGALAGHQLVPDLAATQLLFRADDAQIWLHVEHPISWQGDGLPQLLADLVLETHLAPLAAAVQRLVPISGKILHGNTAAALLGTAQVFDGYRSDPTSGPGWQLARFLCEDQRLSSAIRFSDNASAYRRLSCCLYYRTPAGGRCGDCILAFTP